MEPTKIADAIRAAQEAANAAAPEMKEKAFEVVLAHLLNSSAAPARPMHAPEAQTSATPDTSGGSAFDTQRVATQLGISTEQTNDLFEVKGSTLHVSVKPVGKRLADQQRNLAHALIVGYRFGLNVKEVSISAFNEAADEWNVRDTNLGRNLKDSKALQMKGSGQGKRPMVSLAPRGIERIRDEIVSMIS